MAEAKLRIKLKHDTEANWLKATTFKPLKGELIIYDVDSAHSAPRFKVGDGVKVVGDLPFADKDLAKLNGNNTFTGTNSFTDLLNVASSDFDPANKMGDKLVLHSNKLTYWDGDYARDYNFPSFSSSDSITLAGCQAQNTFTATNEFQNSTNFLGRAYFSGSVDFDGAAPTSRFGLATDQLLSRDSSKTYQMPSKSGTFALTSDIPSFNNFTLLTSKTSDWDTKYDTYYTKGDFGFSRNPSDSTWAANKFYSAVPAEIDIQTLTQPIKIQVSATTPWGEYGGLNLSYGKAKLYGIDNTWADNVGYIDISNGNLTSAVYNADFTLSNPAGRGYGFSVKDTSTLFSVGLNKSEAGDYAQQYYCNINAPLNVTQIHGFTQLTDQPSDWSTKYDSYYVGFDAFNGNSRFWGRSDGLYKPTNDIALNVGQDHKISLDYVGKMGGSITVNYGLDVSTNGITVRGPIKSAAALSLMSTDGPIMLTKNVLSSSSGLIFSVGQTNKMDAMFTISAAAANSTEEDTAVFNLARVQFKGGISTAAGYKLELPTSAGILAHIPTGTSATAMLFGDNTWKEPIKINGETFKSKAGGSIYAPTSTPSFFSDARTNMTTAFCTFTKGQTTPTFLAPSNLVNRYVLETHAKIGNGTEVSWTINYGLKANFTSFTIGVTHKNGYLVMKTCNVADFLYKINSAYVNVSDSGSSFQFRITNMGTSSTTFGIKNNSYTNLTGEFFIMFHYVF